MLQQVINVSSHQVLRPYILDGQLSVHAMWFDIYDGEVSVSKKKLLRIFTQKIIQSSVLPLFSSSQSFRPSERRFIYSRNEKLGTVFLGGLGSCVARRNARFLEGKCGKISHYLPIYYLILIKIVRFYRVLVNSIVFAISLYFCMPFLRVIYNI